MLTNLCLKAALEPVAFCVQFVVHFNGDGRLDLVTANYSNHTVSVYTGNAAIPLAEDPVGSGLFSGFGRGNLWSTSDDDYFSFTAAAGQTLSLAAEIPGNPYNSGLFYVVRSKPDGDRLTYFYADRGRTRWYCR